MSSDNAILIAKFKDEYKVTEAACIDNLDFYPIGSTQEKQTWKSYFENAPSYPTKELATAAANKLATEIYTEYGIIFLNRTVDY